MATDPSRSERRSLRLNTYDYTQRGAYFVTLCSHQRHCLFGEIASQQLQLNAYGAIVHQEWLRSAQLRAEIELDAFVIMPNHLHALVWIEAAEHQEGDRPVAPTGTSAHLRPRSLGALIAGFKAAATTRINALRNSPQQAVWQRGFHEHIIRNEQALGRVREYIQNNPLQWALDEDNPSNWHK